MAEASLTFDDKRARKFFDKVTRQTKNIDAKKRVFVNTIVAKHVVEDVTDHFENQQGGPSQLWPEWSDAYLKHMKRVGKQGNNILTDSARMRNSFGPNKWKIRGDGIEFFNPAKTASGFPYAAAHNEGGPKLPQRKFMWLSAKARKRIVRDTLKYILEGA